MQHAGTWGDEWMKWRYEQYLYHSLGGLWLTKGSAGQALEYAEACLKLAEPSTSRKNLVKGWRLKGQALLAQGHGEQAAAALSCALRMAREIGNPPQLWKTWEAFGTLYEWQRDRAQASTAYQSAWVVIQGVAEGLRDQDLKRTFLGAPPIQQVRSGWHGLRRPSSRGDDRWPDPHGGVQGGSRAHTVFHTRRAWRPYGGTPGIPHDTPLLPVFPHAPGHLCYDRATHEHGG